MSAPTLWRRLAARRLGLGVKVRHVGHVHRLGQDIHMPTDRERQARRLSGPVERRRWPMQVCSSVREMGCTSTCEPRQGTTRRWGIPCNPRQTPCTSSTTQEHAITSGSNGLKSSDLGHRYLRVSQRRLPGQLTPHDGHGYAGTYLQVSLTTGARISTRSSDMPGKRWCSICTFVRSETMDQKSEPRVKFAAVSFPRSRSLGPS
jgi:hypothetical protein